jgi:hypothetical protein
VALDIVVELFLELNRETWGTCEKYVTHAIRVSEWAQVSGKKIETSDLLGCVSNFLHERGRWREKEPVDVECLALQRDVLGERHPHTLQAMHDLAITWKALHRSQDALLLMRQCFDLQRGVLGTAHPDTGQTVTCLEDWEAR